MQNMSNIIYVLLAIGAPGSYLFGLEVTGDPGQAAGITIVYVIVLSIGGLLRRIWMDLEEYLATDASNKLIKGIQQRFSTDEKRYRQQMQYRHRAIVTEGVTLPGAGNLRIQNIFVQLDVMHTDDPKDIEAGLIAKNRRDDVGAIDIWKVFEKDEWLHCAIIGPPGSGKTTLLHHIIIEMCDESNRDRPDLLPIYITLRRHAKTINENGKVSLYELVVNERLFRNIEQMPSKEWFEAQLDANRCLILFDGLDEVEPALRDNVMKWIEYVMQGDNRVLIASRPGGAYSQNHSLLQMNVTVFRLLEFTPDQQQEFVTLWYKMKESMLPEQERNTETYRQHMEQAEDLVAEIQRLPALSQLAVNPLLLTLITSVKRPNMDLPDSRADLYEEMIAIFLWRRESGKMRDVPKEADHQGSYTLNRQQRRDLLQLLAYELMKRGKEDIDFDTAGQILDLEISMLPGEHNTVVPLLRYFKNSTGFLAGNEHEGYRFSHRSFLECFAGYYVRDHQHDQNIMDNFVNQATLDNYFWHEAVMHYCETGADATQIISACIAVEESVPPLVLAMNCMALRNIKVKKNVREQYQRFLDDSLKHDNPAIRRRIAEARLQVHLSNIERSLGGGYLLVAEMITQAEYQLFIDDMIATDVIVIPDHWKETTYQDDGNQPILGMRSEDGIRFCEWLMERDADWEYRLYDLNSVDGGSVSDSNETSNLIASRYLKTVNALDLINSLTNESISQSLTNLQAQLTHAKKLFHALDIDPIVASKLVSDHVNQLLSTITIKGGRSQDLTTARKIARDLNDAHVLATVRIRDISKTILNEFDQMRVRDDLGEYATALVVELNRASILARDSDLVRDLELASKFASDIVSELEHLAEFWSTSNLNHILELVRNLSRDLSHTYDLARGPELARLGNLVHPRSLIYNLESTLEIALVIASASALIHHVERVPDPDRLSQLIIQLDRVRELAASLNLEIKIDHPIIFLNWFYITFTLVLSETKNYSSQDAIQDCIHLSNDSLNYRAKLYLISVIELWSENRHLARYYLARFYNLYILLWLIQVNFVKDEIEERRIVGWLNRYRDKINTIDKVTQLLIEVYEANRQIILRQSGESKPDKGIRIMKKRKHNSS